MELDFRVNGNTKLIGLVGNPVEHSISPIIHNTISSYLKYNIIYVPFRVENLCLGQAIEGLKAINVMGFNITIPYKKEIMRYLDETTREAILMGAVNAVRVVNGRLFGYNTDAEGFFRSFKEEAGTGFKDKKVVILGAGGVARAISIKIALDGAKEISVINRTISNAKEISDLVNQNVNHISESYDYLDSKIKEVIESCDIIINTTSLGMHPNIQEGPLDNINYLNNNQIVYDAIYTPAKTKLLADAEQVGAKTINGLGMLIYQAISAYEIWTGVKIPDEIVISLFGEIRNYQLNK